MSASPSRLARSGVDESSNQRSNGKTYHGKSIPLDSLGAGNRTALFSMANLAKGGVDLLEGWHTSAYL
jgi:hypothetical protein